MSPDLEAALRQEVINFQSLEIGLLQTGRYEEWIKLFTDDLRYWMPVQYVADRREDGEAGSDELAYYDDTLQSLRLRVRRALSNVAWTERPFSRFRYFVQPLTIERRAPDELSVMNNIIVYQTRLQREENWFVGGRDD